MKRIILLLVHALMAVLITTAYANEENSPATPGKTPAIRFTYQVYGELPKRKPAYEEQHFLGTEISEKWNTFARTLFPERAVRNKTGDLVDSQVITQIS